MRVPRTPPAALLAALVWGLAVFAACAPAAPKRALSGEACEKPKDCVYGTECISKTCRFITFGDCEGETTSSGAPTCLNGQKCRDGKCTV